MPVAKTIPPRQSAEQDGYTRDFYTWTQQQAALLRANRLEAVDATNLAEEIEGLGRNEFDKLVSFHRLILLHMLKVDHQPERQTRSWAISIANYRDSAAEILSDNPGLKPRVGDAVSRAYKYARRDAAAETGLPLKSFPEACPYTLADIRERRFPFD